MKNILCSELFVECISICPKLQETLTIPSFVSASQSILHSHHTVNQPYCSLIKCQNVNVTNAKVPSNSKILIRKLLSTADCHCHWRARKLQYY